MGCCVLLCFVVFYYIYVVFVLSFAMHCCGLFWCVAVCCFMLNVVVFCYALLCVVVFRCAPF